jgi:serine/threonine protein kinase
MAKAVNGKYFALKTISKDYIFGKKEERHILNEREIFYELNSPFCVKLFAEFEDRSNVYYAMEYVPGGELFRSLELNTTLSADVSKFYLTEIFAALEHIHSIGFVYRDLKPENIAIDEDGHVKIVDFGSAIRSDSHASGKLYTNCTSVPYMSPEQMNGKTSGGYTKIVDWWSYGILAYEIQVGHTPFCQNKDTEYEILLKILKNKITFPSSFNPKAKILITDLLQYDPKVRITDPRRLKDHDYFDEVKHWGNVYEKHLVPPFVPEMCRDGDSHYFILGEEKSSKHWKSHNLETLVKMF